MKTKFNKVSNTNRNFRPKNKMSFSQRAVLTSLPFLMALSPAQVFAVSGGTITSGTNGSITYTDGSGTTAGTGANVNIATDNKYIIDWTNFDIANGQTVAFTQADSASVVLNRVTAGDGTTIAGNLTANGIVFIVDTNGVTFTSTSSVDTAGLLVSTLDIDNNDFENGEYKFAQADASSALAKIITGGEITVDDGGFICLLSPYIQNTGKLYVGTSGTITLASGTEATVNLTSSGLVSFVASTSTATDDNSKAIENTGVIQADGGFVFLSVDAASNLTANVINNSGTIEATSIEALTEGGSFENTDTGLLSATKALDLTATTVTNSGTLSYTGDDAANMRVIEIRADEFENTDTGVIQSGYYTGENSYLGAGINIYAGKFTNAGEITATNGVSITNLDDSFTNSGSISTGYYDADGNLVKDGSSISITSLYDSGTYSYYDFTNSGEIKSTSMLEINKVDAFVNTDTGKISSTTDLSLYYSESVENSGSITSDNDVSLKTEGDFKNSGTIESTGSGSASVDADTITIIDTTGILENDIDFTADTINFTTTDYGLIINSAVLNADTINLTGYDFENTGEIYGDLNFVANSYADKNYFIGEIKNSGTIEGTFSFNTDGFADYLYVSSIKNTGTITITSGNFDVTSDVYTTKISVDSFENVGTITVANGDFVLDSTLTNTGSIEAKSVSITNDTAFINEGTIKSTADYIIITATSVTNAESAIIDATGNLTLNSTSLENKGKITVKEFDTQTLENIGFFENTGTIILNGAFTLADDVYTDASTGTISAGSISLGSTSATFTNKGTLIATDGITISVPENFVNDGSITGSSVTFVGKTTGSTTDYIITYFENSGKIEATNGDIEFKGGSATATSTLSINSFLNTLNGEIIATDDMDLSDVTITTFNNAGLIDIGADFSINTNFINTGTIVGKNIYVDLGTEIFTNTGTLELEGGTLYVTAGGFINSGTLTSKSTLGIETNTDFTNNSLVYSDDDITIIAGSLSNNSVIWALDDINITTLAGAITSGSSNNVIMGDKLTLSSATNIGTFNYTIDDHGEIAVTIQDLYISANSLEANTIVSVDSINGTNYSVGNLSVNNFAATVDGSNNVTTSTTSTKDLDVDFNVTYNSGYTNEKVLIYSSIVNESGALTGDYGDIYQGYFESRDDMNLSGSASQVTVYTTEDGDITISNSDKSLTVVEAKTNTTNGSYDTNITIKNGLTSTTGDAYTFSNGSILIMGNIMTTGAGNVEMKAAGSILSLNSTESTALIQTTNLTMTAGGSIGQSSGDSFSVSSDSTTTGNILTSLSGTLTANAGTLYNAASLIEYETYELNGVTYYKYDDTGNRIAKSTTTVDVGGVYIYDSNKVIIDSIIATGLEGNVEVTATLDSLYLGIYGTDYNGNGISASGDVYLSAATSVIVNGDNFTVATVNSNDYIMIVAPESIGSDSKNLYVDTNNLYVSSAQIDIYANSEIDDLTIISNTYTSSSLIAPKTPDVEITLVDSLGTGTAELIFSKTGLSLGSAVDTNISIYSAVDTTVTLSGNIEVGSLLISSEGTSGFTIDTSDNIIVSTTGIFSTLNIAGNSQTITADDLAFDIGGSITSLYAVIDNSLSVNANGASIDAGSSDFDLTIDSSGDVEITGGSIDIISISSDGKVTLSATTLQLDSTVTDAIKVIEDDIANNPDTTIYSSADVITASTVIDTKGLDITTKGDVEFYTKVEGEFSVTTDGNVNVANNGDITLLNIANTAAAGSSVDVTFENIGDVAIGSINSTNGTIDTVSLGVFGNITDNTLGQTADGDTDAVDIRANDLIVKATSLGTLSVDGADVDVTAVSKSFGEDGNSIETSLSTVDIITSKDSLDGDKGVYIANSGSDLTLKSVLADSNVEIIVTGVDSTGAGYDLNVYSITASGQSVSLISEGDGTNDDTKGNVVDVRNDTDAVPYNVTAKSLYINANSVESTVDGQKFDTDVSYLTISINDVGTADISNEGILIINADSLLASGNKTFTATDIVIDDLGDTAVISTGDLSLIAENNIVFKDTTDTIIVDGTVSIVVMNKDDKYSSMTDGLTGMVVLGNIYTYGQSITITAQNHISIALLDTTNGGAYSAADVTVASTSGYIIDNNGDINNIVGDTVTLEGSSYSTDYVDSQLSMAYTVYNSLKSTAEALSEDVERQEAVVASYKELYSENSEEYKTAYAEYEKLQAEADSLEDTAVALYATFKSLDLAFQAAQLAVDVADIIAGAAQAIPLTGDAGAAAIVSALNLTLTTAELARSSAEIAYDLADSDAGDAAVAAAVAQANANATLLAVNQSEVLVDTAQASLDSLEASALQTEAKVSVASAIYNAVALASEADNAIGSSTQALGVTANTLNATNTQVNGNNASIYIQSEGDLGLGNINAGYLGNDKYGYDNAVVEISALGDITLQGNITSSENVVLYSATGSIENGTSINADSSIVMNTTNLIAGAATGIGDLDTTGVIQTQGVESIYADGGTGDALFENTANNNLGVQSYTTDLTIDDIALEFVDGNGSSNLNSDLFKKITTDTYVVGDGDYRNVIEGGINASDDITLIHNGGNIYINEEIATTETEDAIVTIKAEDGSILGTTDDIIHVTGGATTLVAEDAIGEVDNRLESSITSLTAVTSVGDIYINEANSITLTDVSTTDGIVDIIAKNNIVATSVVVNNDSEDEEDDITLLSTNGGIQVGTISTTVTGTDIEGDVKLTAATLIENDANTSTVITTDNLVLTAQSGIGVNGADATTSIDTAVDTLTATTTTGDVNISEADGIDIDLISTDSGNVTAKSIAGDLNITEIVATDNVTLVASGEIVNTSGDDITMVTADELSMQAGTDIGTEDNVIDVDVNSIVASTTTGDIYIDNPNATTIGGVFANLDNADVIGLKADDGKIVVNAVSLTIKEEVEAKGDITLNATNGNILAEVQSDTTSSDANNDVRYVEDSNGNQYYYTTTGSITSAQGDVSLTASEDITTTSSSIEATLGSVEIIAGESVSLSASVTAGSNIDITANDGDVITTSNTYSEQVVNVDEITLEPTSTTITDVTTIASISSTTSGNVTIKALGDDSNIETVGDISTASGNIKLYATDDIITTGAISAIDGYAFLTAKDSVDIKNSVTATDTDGSEDSYVVVDALSGSINSTGEIAATNGVDMLAATDIDIDSKITSSDGFVDMESGVGNITIDGNINAGDYVSLNAEGGSVTTTASINAGSDVDIYAGNGSVTIGAGVTSNTEGNITMQSVGDDITIGGVVQTTDGNVTLLADNDITINSAVKVGDGFAKIVAYNDVNVNANITATIVNDTNDETTTKDTVDVTDPENYIPETGDVYIYADGALASDSSSKITADRDIDLVSGSYIGVDGTVNAGEDISMTALNGYIIVDNNMTANGDIVLKTAETDESADAYIQVTENGSVITAGNITLDSADEIDINGTIRSSGDFVKLEADDFVKINATVNSVADDVDIDAGTYIESTSTGKIYAGADIDMLAGTTIDTNATILADGNVDIKASDGSVTASSAIRSDVAGDVTIIALGDDSDITASGAITTESGNITLKASDDITTSGFVTATDGNVYINAYDSVEIQSTITTKDTDDSGDGIVVIDAKAGTITTTDKGSIEAASDVDMFAGSYIDTNGSITSGGYVDMLSGKYINANSSISAADYVYLEAEDGSVTTTASIKSTVSGDVEIIAEIGDTATEANIATSGAISTADGNVTLTADSNIQTSSSLTANNGYVYVDADNNVTINAPVNAYGDGSGDDNKQEGDITIIAGGAVETTSIFNGSLTADTDVEITAGTSVSTDATITADNNIDIVANAGSVIATADISSVVDGDINITAIGDSSDVLTSGEIATTIGNITLSADESIITDGSITATEGNVGILAENNIDINAAVKATGDSASDLGDITINANVGYVQTTSSGSLNGTGTVDIDASTYIDTDASITAGDDVDMLAGTSITTDGTIKADENIDMYASAGSVSINNSVSSLVEGDVTITAVGDTSDITVATSSPVSTTDGNITMTAGNDITTSSSLTATDGYVYIDATNDVTLNAAITATIVTNEGGDDSNEEEGDVTIIAGGLVSTTNRSDTFLGTSGTIAADKDVEITAGTGITTNATITSNNNIDIVANDGSVIATEAIKSSVEGNVNITAQIGNITTSDNASIFTQEGNVTLTAGNAITTGVTVTATDGYVKINANSVDINASVTATGTATGNDDSDPIPGSDSNKSADDYTPQTGDVSIYASSQINANGVITADTDVEMTAGSTITTYKKLDAADDVLLDAGSSIETNSDVQADNNVVMYAKAGDVTATDSIASVVSGDVTITSEMGNITTSSKAPISTADGNITLTADNDITTNANITATSGYVYVDAGNDVVINSAVKATGLASDDSDKEAGDITILADGVVATTATLTADTDVEITAGKGITTDANITATNGYVDMLANTGDITINSTVTANGVYSGSDDTDQTLSPENGDVIITATTGNITTTSAGQLSATTDVEMFAGADITTNAKITSTDDVYMHSVSDIQTNAIITATNGNITMLADNDNVEVNANATAGTYIDIDATAGSVVTTATLTAKDGDVDIYAKTNVDIQETIDASENVLVVAEDGNIQTTSKGDITAGDSVDMTAGTDITISASVDAEDGYVYAQAGNDVTINAAITAEGTGADSTSNKEDGDITIIAGGSIATTSKNDTIYTTNGTLTADTDVELHAGTGIITDAIIKTTSDSVTMLADTGDIAINANVTSGTYIDIDATVGSVVTTATLTANDGDVEITADQNIDIQETIIATEDVDIDATNGYIATTSKGDIQAGNNAELTAGTTITTNATIDADVLVDMHAGTGIETNAAITADTESVTMLADTGDIAINAQVSANTYVDIEATDGNIVTDAVSSKIYGSIEAGTYINMTAGDSITTNETIKTTAESVTMLADTGDIAINANVTSGTYIDIDATVGSVLTTATLRANGGDVEITADQNIDIQETIIATEDVDIDATNGYIATTSKGDIQSGNNAELTAGTTITTNATIVADVLVDMHAGSGIETNAAITADTESVTMLSDTGDIAINAQVSANTYVDVEATDGNITTDAVSSKIYGSIEAGTYVNMTAGDGITTNESVFANGGDVTMLAENNVDINDAVYALNDVDVDATNGYIATSATGDVTADNNVELQSEGNITTNGTITADNNVEMIANDGDITINDTVEATNGKATIWSKTKDVLANALVWAKGKIGITAGNDIITTGAIESEDEIEMIATSTVQTGNTVDSVNDIIVNAGTGITVGGALTSSTGNVYATTNTGDITINDTVKSTTATVTLEATAGSILGSATTPTYHVEAKDLVLTAGDSVGTEDTAIRTNVETLNANITNDIYIDEADAINVDSVIATNAEITAGSNITIDTLTTTGNSDLVSSAGSVTTNTSGLLSADALTVEANTGINLDTKVTSADLETDKGDININETDSIVLDSVMATTGNVDVTADSTIEVDYVSGTDVTLTSTNSDIIEDGSDSDVDIDATNLTLTADNGSIGETNNAIEINTNSLIADVYKSIYLVEEDSVIIGDLNANDSIEITAGESITSHTDTVVTTEDLVLDAGTGIDVDTVVESLTADTIVGDVNIEQTGDITVNSLTGENVTLEASGSIALDYVEATATNGKATLISGGDITDINDTDTDENMNVVADYIKFDAKGGIGVDNAIEISTSDLTIAASGGVNLDNDSDAGITINAVTTDGDFILSQKGDITIADDITITGGYSIDLTSTEGTLYQNADLEVEDDGDISLTAGVSIIAADGVVTEGDSGTVSYTAPKVVLPQILVDNAGGTEGLVLIDSADISTAYTGTGAIISAPFVQIITGDDSHDRSYIEYLFDTDKIEAYNGIWLNNRLIGGLLSINSTYVTESSKVKSVSHDLGYSLFYNDSKYDTLTIGRSAYIADGFKQSDDEDEWEYNADDNQ